MKVYISGPITGRKESEVRDVFGRAEEELIGYDQEPVSPLKNGLRWSDSWKEHMLADIKMLMDCEAIYLLPDWTMSAGARIERHIADEMGMMVLNQEVMLKQCRLEKATRMALDDMDFNH